VNHHHCNPFWRAVLASGALLVAAPAALPAADTPASSTAHPDNSAGVEAQLETARRNLEQAAREVAQLSAQLSTQAIDEIMPMFAPGRAIIGVQLERAAGGAGARVREVSPGGPAADAGMLTGDVIVAVNGTTVAGADPTRQVLTMLRDVKPDTKVSVRVLRDGKPREFTLTTRASPGIFATAHGLPELGLTLPDVQGAFMFHRPLMDMELATLTPRLGSYFGTDRGVLVVRAPADRALQLEDGDVILAIDGRQPTSGSHATRILGSYQPGEKVRLRILREHKTLEVEATLPAAPGPRHEELMRHDAAAPAAVPPRKVGLFGNGLA